MNFLQGLLNRSDAFGIGSPTINADAVAPVWNLLSHVDAINNRKRPALVFGSYGWSGEAVPKKVSALSLFRQRRNCRKLRSLANGSHNLWQNKRVYPHI